MVKSINLSKSSKFDLSKPAQSIDLSKSNLTPLASKAPVLELASKKPVAATPKKPWDIDTTDPVEGMKKVSIPLLPVDLYYTPDEVVDPQDCGRYPNSPYCGGVPFSFLPIGFEPEIVIDECNIGIGIQPVLFFIKLPQQQIVLRNKSCQPKQPPPPPTTPASVYLPMAPPGCGWEVWWALTTTTREIPAENIYEAIDSFTSDNINVANPYLYGNQKRFENGNLVYQYNGRIQLRTDAGGLCRADYSSFKPGLDAAYYSGYSYFNGEYLYDEASNTNYSITSLFTTGVSLITARLAGGEVPPVRYVQQQSGDFNNFAVFSPTHVYVTARLFCNGIIIDPTSENPPPPSPLPPPKPEEMNCCPQLTALLQLLIARVAQLDARVQTLDEQIKDTNKCLGIEEYPASLPSTIINQDEGFLANFVAGLNDQVEVKNLTQLVVWFFERFDEVMGQWEIPIQIKDSDPTTPGDQPVGVKLPNLAEAQAEQFTMAFQSTVNLDLLINIATRILAEVGQIKQQGFKGYGLTQTLVDYFNYEYSENAVDMPLSFAPDKDKFDELLKETVLKVAYPEFTDNENFKTTEMRLLESAAIIKALNWRKVDAGGDIKSQIKKSVLARAKQLDDEIKRQQDDLDKFVVDAEKGYPDLPGMPSPGEPYGESYAQRPIVKRIEE